MSLTLLSGLSNLTTLTYLNLSNAMFDDSITTQLANLTSLTQLDLSCSTEIIDVSSSSVNLTSSYRFTLGSLYSYFANGNLYSLNLNWLQGLTNLELTGEVPECIGYLPSLAYLVVSRNHLIGSVPVSSFRSSNIVYIGLGFNRLTLKIDDSSSKLNSNIQELEFASCNIGANNNLQGTIPAQLADVEVINLSGNNFSGIAPAQIGELSSTRYVSFAGNKRNGQIPPSFCKKVNALEVLDLSYNSLSGKIPRSLGNYLSGNNFDGPFLDVVRRFQYLEGLKLENNRFDGRIPQFVGKLHNLRLLVLASNLLSGSIPQEILQLEKLQYLGLSNNSLSGLIPNKLENLKMLRVRPTDGTILGFLISSAFVGAELDIVTKRSSYQLELVYSYHRGVYISLDALTGSIPEEIGLLQGLSMMNLSYNYLSGEIPKTIGCMSGLESLEFNLSSNALSGEIPHTNKS
ncbi:hypothetical protein AgCh_024769 [Apium graveolens]